MFRFLCLFFVLAAFTSCGRKSARQQPEVSGAEKQYVFMPPMPPAGMMPEEARNYLRVHYWDRFDFSDTMFVHKADSGRMFRSFVEFVDIISDRPTDPAPMQALMKRASASRPMLDYFAGMAEALFADPNSPHRNDEFYIPVLEARLAAPFYDEYERMAPEYDLQLAKQNRIGQRANDFRYTVASGRSATLYGLKADFVLLFINNPGCPMCREIRDGICASPMLSDLIARGTLKVLALYPDEDLGEWRRHFDEIPASWINAYDAGCTIEKGRLYSLRAIPALYLLDSRKQVLLKDVTEVAQVEELIDRRG